MLNTAAPDFTVIDVDGGAKHISLHDFRGQVVVLNFWASWCTPCLEEEPSLVALQLKMKSQIQVLAISTDEDPAAYKKYVDQHTAGLLTIRDSKQQSNALYGSHKYPETFIIDRNGIIRRKLIGPQDFTKPDMIDYLAHL